MFDKYQPITEMDVFDFYGVASLDRSALSNPDAKAVNDKLQGFRAQYLEALKRRFGYWAKDGKGATDIASMIGSLKKSLEESIMDQAVKMRQTGGGFNIMEAMSKMGLDQKNEANLREKKQTHDLASNLAAFKLADYPTIAKCIIQLYEATGAKEIILAIDTLNSLQHCGGYVLVDFVAGVRNPSDPMGHKVLNGVFEMKKNAKSASAFMDKMSPEVQALVKTQL